MPATPGYHGTRRRSMFGGCWVVAERVNGKDIETGRRCT